MPTLGIHFRDEDGHFENFRGGDETTRIGSYGVEMRYLGAEFLLDIAHQQSGPIGG